MSNHISQIKVSIEDSIAVKQRLLKSEELLSQIDEVCTRITTAMKSGGKVFFAGNGGSAADAQHLAAEFVSRFAFDRPGLPALALTTDTSAMTAIGNDYGFQYLFSRQIESLCTANDTVVLISTSGNSPNILEAAKAAKKAGAFCIALTGESGGQVRQIADISIKMPSNSTARIQEAHIAVGHIICQIVESELFADRR
jgi:D-sedoheptulose 7-phosphate isomerase